jgi:CubicO group peptidase (beta-lactamase class C family)
MIAIMAVAAVCLPDSAAVESVSASQTSAAEPELATILDTQLPAQLEARGIPGASVTIADPTGLRFARGYGMADLEGGRPVDPHHTLFHIGSTAKLLTWTAVMQQVEQGRLDLNVDVNQYLDFRIPDTYAAPITLRHLTTHTAGF